MNKDLPLDDLLREIEEAAEKPILPGSWPLTIADLDRKILRIVKTLRKRTEALEDLERNLKDAEKLTLDQARFKVEIALSVAREALEEE